MEKKRIGRPPQPRETKWDDEILSRLADGESLRQICLTPRTPGMPSASGVRYWVADDPAFAAIYARARTAGLDAIAEEIQEIADDARSDYTEDGKLNMENVNRSRLRVDSRKWLLSKLNPSKYGDETRMQLTGMGGGPVQSEHTIRFIEPVVVRQNTPIPLPLPSPDGGDED